MGSQRYYFASISNGTGDIYLGQPNGDQNTDETTFYTTMQANGAAIGLAVTDLGGGNLIVNYITVPGSGAFITTSVDGAQSVNVAGGVGTTTGQGSVFTYTGWGGAAGNLYIYGPSIVTNTIQGYPGTPGDSTTGTDSKGNSISSYSTNGNGGGAFLSAGCVVTGPQGNVTPTIVGCTVDGVFKGGISLGISTPLTGGTNGNILYNNGDTIADAPLSAFLIDSYAILGTTSNTPAGMSRLGEYISTSKAVGSPVSLTTATAANIVSISLTAGDWDVSGIVSYTASSATVTQKAAGISATSATLPTDGSEGYSGASQTTTTNIDSITLTRKQLLLAGTTTVYLVGKATFSAGTVGGFGVITARRAH
jgi:hypothetical protein